MQHEVLFLPTHTIEGVGPKRAEALARGDVHTLADLLRARPNQLSHLVGGVSAATAAKWQQAARMLWVPHLDADLAEAFTDGGIDSLNELGRASLKRAEAVTQAGKDARRLDKAPSVYSLAAMQREAARLTGTGGFTGRVVDDAGQAAAGLSVAVGGRETETDDVGRFGLIGVDAGQQTWVIKQDGRTLLRGSAFVSPDGLALDLLLRLAPPLPVAEPEPISEYEGFVRIHPEDRVRVLTVTTDALPEEALLQVHRERSDGAWWLLHLFRTRIGDTVQAQQLIVSAAELPPRAALGDVLRWRGGAFEATDLELYDVAMVKARAAAPELADFIEQMYAAQPAADEPEASAARASTASASRAPAAGEDGGWELQDYKMYYFHGQEGCALCVPEAGWYFGRKKPHDRCDCVNEPFPVYRRYVYTSFKVEIQVFELSHAQSLSNCGPAPYSISQSFPVEVEDNMDEDLRSYALGEGGLELPELLIGGSGVYHNDLRLSLRADEGEVEVSGMLGRWTRASYSVDTWLWQAKITAYRDAELRHGDATTYVPANEMVQGFIRRLSKASINNIERETCENKPAPPYLGRPSGVVIR